MTRQELLLAMLSEECAEVIQTISKSLRFGLQNIRPGEDETNAQRILHEFYDAYTVFEMLLAEGVLSISEKNILEHVKTKKIRVEEYLLVSKKCGRLD